jgi:endonuclease-8
LPEGHSIRKLADQWSKFVGQVFTFSSPQGRFAEEAKLLSGRRLVATDAHGKHLFLEFEGELSVHIHLGLYGRFFWHSGEPEPVGAIRMRAVHGGQAIDLRGPTRCEVLTPEGVAAIHARLGPDPLRPADEVDPLLPWAATSAWPIGRTLMEQSKIAGIGNVYRAEILFILAMNPYKPTSEVTEDEWRQLWALSRTLLQAGVKHSGPIATALKGLPKPATLPPGTPCAQRTYVYKRTKRACVACGTLVEQKEMEGRRLYYCPHCQSVPEGMPSTRYTPAVAESEAV